MTSPLAEHPIFLPESKWQSGVSRSRCGESSSGGVDEAAEAEESGPFLDVGDHHQVFASGLGVEEVVQDFSVIPYSWTLTGDDACINNNSEGRDDGSDWNDDLSSVIVAEVGEPPDDSVLRNGVPKTGLRGAQKARGGRVRAYLSPMPAILAATDVNRGEAMAAKGTKDTPDTPADR